VSEDRQDRSEGGEQGRRRVRWDPNKAAAAVIATTTVVAASMRAGMSQRGGGAGRDGG
jgi:hypothetical protein